MNELQVMEHGGVRVITTQQLSEAYETDSRVISNNFNRNKERYMEGKHYICLEGEDKRCFVDHHQIDDGSKKAGKLYLWTEKGAFLHAKSLNTDKAWEVYDRLVETYFNVRQSSIDRSQVSPLLQSVAGIVENLMKQELEQKRLAEQQERTERKVNAISETFEKTSDTEDFKVWCKKCISKIAESEYFAVGATSKERYMLAWNESYERLNQKRPCRLKQRVKTAQGDALQNGATQSKAKQINALTIISMDKDLKPVYEMVIKEMMICYCVQCA